MVVTVALSSMLEILTWQTAHAVIMKILYAAYLTLYVKLYRY
jgi:hypothetical protein